MPSEIHSVTLFFAIHAVMHALICIKYYQLDKRRWAFSYSNLLFNRLLTSFKFSYTSYDYTIRIFSVRSRLSFPERNSSLSLPTVHIDSSKELRLTQYRRTVTRGSRRISSRPTFIWSLLQSVDIRRFNRYSTDRPGCLLTLITSPSMTEMEARSVVEAAELDSGKRTPSKID